MEKEKVKVSSISPIDVQIKKLRRFNLIMGFLHFIQGLFMIIVTFLVDTPGETYPVYSNYLTFNRDLGGLVANPRNFLTSRWELALHSFYCFQRQRTLAWQPSVLNGMNKCSKRG